jgi:hypothetical protein
MLALCAGCTSKPKPPATSALPPGSPPSAQAAAPPVEPAPQPSLAQRFMNSFPHPGDGARRIQTDDDKRDKDNDF